MSKYENISLLIEDIDSILDTLFTGGLSAAQSNVVNRMEAVGEECGKLGLGFAAEALDRMAKAIEKKRHSMEYDYSEVVSDFCLLGSYIDAVKRRISLQEVRESFTKDNGENEPGKG